MASREEGRLGFLHRHDFAGTRYEMRQKLFAIGDDFWIHTEDGQRAFKVNGKALRIRDTFVLESPSGQELVKAQKKALHIRDTMKIERDGETVATVKKALVAPLRERFKVELEDDGELSATGNIVDHEYEIERDGQKVAEVSKRWFRVRDSYGIEIAAGEDEALILAAAACIDEMGDR
ncbi:MAG: LURP-one-related family protein [Solirubrobacterales bacterium]|nr:LURP-one-related family protein [Solirubrobacterales bacterium]